MREIFQAKQSPLVGAHRGASHYYPENTMLSFQKAVELGADYIELDVHLTKDNIPVIMHDANLERTSDGKGRIKDFTVEELKQLDVGRWFGEEFAGQRIPTLHEVLSWSKGRTGVSIEIKQIEERYDNLEQRILDVIYDTNTMDQVQAMSFNHNSIKKIKELDNRIFAGIILFAELYDPIRVAQQMKVDFYNTPWLFHTIEQIRQLHEAGFVVCGGHNDQPEKWVEMQEWGIDMAETNMPDVMKAQTKEKRQFDIIVK
ncbi:glycerophosphodiester phosphodiesterase [Bacillaceae bacterium SIJ1]|uniref:glycerophosphodiester phosphodiesterase n=1 Tax=Litoribacterium kuwaitense TaxID=1398745 RepID=UPI0013EC4FB6|nr:glycerophosphodiester phosphodiesterase family protein [Litoribacterium kuwaitense]NGP45538.1 glycerophosphodiester phosphodiesterase [Litoribacterium kuwaitense]